MEHLTTEFYEISREPNPDCISLDSIHKRVLKRQGILMNRYVFIGQNKLIKVFNEKNHGLRTPNEGINQGYLKKWADVKICFGRT